MISKKQAKQQITKALQADLQGYNVQKSDVKYVANKILKLAFRTNDAIPQFRLQEIYTEVMSEEFGVIA